MTVTQKDDLEDRLDAAAERAERIEQANRQQQRIESATDSIERLNRHLTAVEATAEELAFYVGLLEAVFDESRSDCRGLERNVEEAARKADIGEDELLEAAQEDSFAELETRVQEAEDLLEDGIDAVCDRIEDEHVDQQLDELATAKELNSILGGGNAEFVDHLETMEEFLTSSMWDTSRAPQTVASRWDRLRERWEEHEDKQSWDRFQSEHGISDTTVKELKQFTDQDVVRLSDLSMQTLREVKDVDELESALEVALQT